MMKEYNFLVAVISNLICIGFGLSAICLARKLKTSSKIILIPGMLMILCGIGTLITGLVLNQNIIMLMGKLWVGIFILGVGILCFVPNWRQGECISATYTGYRRKNGTSCIPIFQYSYKGKEYENEVNTVFNEQMIKERYVISKKYDIFISPEDPNVCWIEIASGNIGNIFIIAIGILVLYVSMKV